MNRNELKINPNYKSVPPPDTSEFKGTNHIEYSHVAWDAVGDKLFLRIKWGLLQIRFETDSDLLEFNREAGREIAQAILDLCREEGAK